MGRFADRVEFYALLSFVHRRTIHSQSPRQWAVGTLSGLDMQDLMNKLLNQLPHSARIKVLEIYFALFFISQQHYV